MEFEYRKNTSTLFFRVLVIVDIMSLFLAAVAGVMSRPSLGKQINASFLRELKLSEICFQSAFGFLLLFAFLLVSLVLMAMYGKNLYSTCLIGGSIIAFLVTSSNALYCLVHKPVVVKCECVRRDISYNYETDAKFYIIYFSNGTSSHATQKEWQDAVGKTYYIVMCGHTSIGSFPAADYTLEESIHPIWG